MVTFAIVGPNDVPLYILGDEGATANAKFAHLNQFILHASLDIVHEKMLEKTDTFLKDVDQFNETTVSAFVTAGGVIFLLLHKKKNYSQYRIFFEKVHEIFVKVIMNPFYKLYTPINSKSFDRRVRIFAKQFLLEYII